MKKLSLFCLFSFFIFGTQFSHSQSGCGDPMANNYYCEANQGLPPGDPGACGFIFSGGFPVFTLPAGFSDDGSCEYDGVDENNDGIPDNSLQGCESPGYFNYNPNFAVWDPSSYVNTYSDQITTCIPFTYGCVEENACNYNSSANTNDVSNPCTFPFGCDTCSGEDDGTGTVVDNDAE